MDEPIPDQIAAAIRDPDSGLTPDQITVFCDGCGTLATRDYLVGVDDGQKARFAIARAHLTKNEGWCCDHEGDYCPDCVTESRTGE